MSLDDLRWAVDGLARACRTTLGDACRIWVSEDGFEPTAHLRFPEVLAYCRASIPPTCRDEFPALSTNG